MDPFSNSTNSPAHSSGAAGQPSVTDVAQLNNDEVMATWNHLKLQVNSFSAIVSIPAGTFGSWSVADKNRIIHLMKREVQQDDVHFAVDTDLPDRVYLASRYHFDQIDIVLYHSPAQELPTVLYKYNQKAENAAVDNTSPGVPISVDSATAADTVGKRGSKTKAPASGIRRPRNSWIIYRTARQAEIIKAEGPMPNSAMSTRISQEWKKLAPVEKRRWQDLAWQEKLEHKRNNPHYKYQPRRPGEIKKGNTRKAAGTLSTSSPTNSSASLSIAGTSEATLGREDDMTGVSIAGDISMSLGEGLAHYAIYDNHTPIIGNDDPKVSEDQEWVNQSLLNFGHNPAAVSGGEAHASDISPYAASIDELFEDRDPSFDFGTLFNNNIDPALPEDRQAAASKSTLEGDFDTDSLFGGPVDAPDYNMTTSDWMDIMNRESFHSP
ncbi:hypothetical protein DL767_004878 [Monosporascus sp. MG133]|nr:hypothetical protein DL767_004878 [Monosporascus sp. MG133]